VLLQFEVEAKFFAELSGLLSSLCVQKLAEPQRALQPQSSANASWISTGLPLPESRDSLRSTKQNRHLPTNYFLMMELVI